MSQGSPHHVLGKLSQKQEQTKPGQVSDSPSGDMEYSVLVLRKGKPSPEGQLPHLATLFVP